MDEIRRFPVEGAQRLDEIRDQLDMIGRGREVTEESIRFLFDHIDALTAERDALRAGLEEALDGMEDMRAYVDPYFAEKRGHDAYIARAQALLDNSPSPVEPLT